MRIAFLGTPDFALPSLDMLIARGDDIAVFTQPDRPKGRHGTLTPPPVKEAALAHGLPVYQFEKIRLPEGVKALSGFAPELMVTAAFGQILSGENLAVPKYGCINVHGSLLPKYRGAAPIQCAVINGETTTGITTMLTDVGLDSGDILMQRAVEIGENETAGELFIRLATLGAELLKETIEALEAGTLTRTKQDDGLATKCRMIKKEQARIDFSQPAGRIHDLVRGMNPSPVAYAELDGKPVKIYATKKCGRGGEGVPGECHPEKEGLFVTAGDGMIEILELQFPGAKRMEAKDAMRGHDLLGKVFQ